MNTQELIKQVQADGLALSFTQPDHLHVIGQPEAITRWTPALKERKAEVITALAGFERRRNQVLALLKQTPETPYAFVVDTESGPDVIVAVGIRGVATFEMAIPRDRYDPFVFIQFLDAINSPHRH